MAGWTCPECGLNYDTVAPSDAAVALRSYPRRYRQALAVLEGDDRRDALLRRRPQPEVWSALEYTAHVGEVEDALATIVKRMTSESHPTLDMFDADERAAAARYNEQDPEEVLTGLQGACTAAAHAVAGVPPTEWTRLAAFPFGERDALTMARNAVHEGVHHLRDVNRVLEQVTGRRALD